MDSDSIFLAACSAGLYLSAAAMTYGAFVVRDDWLMLGFCAAGALISLVGGTLIGKAAMNTPPAKNL